MRERREELTEEEEISRIRRPKGTEVLAVVTQMLGSDKLRVQCEDGKERIARIPGKMRKRVWIRINDLILVEPWKDMPTNRADVAWRYTPTQANWMQRNGLLKSISVG